MCRLGSGARALDDDKSGYAFGRVGRVDACLARRTFLLDAVQRLAISLQKVSVHPHCTQYDAGTSCETAEYFKRCVVDPAIERIELSLNAPCATPRDIATAFPFSAFLASFSMDEAMDLGSMNLNEAKIAVLSGVSVVRRVFKELKEYRFLELLRSSKQRTDYLLTSLARVVALTCAHAAIKRRDLLELGFVYETIIFEEAAQITDAETLIPLTLQDSKFQHEGLRRVVLIGDDRQLPPVVKNEVLRAHCGLDQSLFVRLLRLGATRARPRVTYL